MAWHVWKTDVIDKFPPNSREIRLGTGENQIKLILNILEWRLIYILSVNNNEFYRYRSSYSYFIRYA